MYVKFSYLLNRHYEKFNDEATHKRTEQPDSFTASSSQ